MIISFYKIYLRILSKYYNNKILSYVNNIKISSDINVLDLGAAGGVSNIWTNFFDKFKFFLVEPNKDEAKLLNKDKFVIINKLFSNKNKKVYLNLTKKPECSSVLVPNYTFLKNYFDVGRFKIIKKIKLKSETIDNYFKNTKLDFIKLDTEGYEKQILLGGEKKLNHVLGVEIECALQKIREKQCSFEEIKTYLEKKNFIFVDFLNVTRWQKIPNKFFGIPVISDCLFIKDPKIVINSKRNLEQLKKLIIILLVYSRYDLLEDISDKIDKNLKDEIDFYKISSILRKKYKIFEKIGYLNYLTKKILDNR